MIIQCRINKDDNKVYRLCSWNARDFASTGRIQIQTDDLREIKQAFTNIESLEIYQANTLVAEYTEFDGYSSIMFLGDVFVEGEVVFAPCLEVVLTKTNLVQMVERLNEQVNPVIDESSMTIQELKERRLEQISEAGSETIYAGTQVTLSNGQTKSYKYTIHDQIDLDTYFDLFSMLPTDTDYANTYISWHATGEICQQYSLLDVMLIYFALKELLFYTKTYTNVLKMYVSSMDNIEDVRNAYYGMSLPKEYQDSMSQTLQTEMATILAIKEQLFPTTQGDDVEPIDDEYLIPNEGNEGNEGNEDNEGNESNEGNEEVIENEETE